jgi:hypothetical protein
VIELEDISVRAIEIQVELWVGATQPGFMGGSDDSHVVHVGCIAAGGKQV